MAVRHDSISSASGIDLTFAFISHGFLNASYGRNFFESKTILYIEGTIKVKETKDFSPILPSIYPDSFIKKS
jgi:hypothetical protein